MFSVVLHSPILAVQWLKFKNVSSFAVAPNTSRNTRRIGPSKFSGRQNGTLNRPSGAQMAPLFILIRAPLCVHETECSHDTPQTPRGCIFDDFRDPSRLNLNNFQWLLAPFLAFISGTHIAESAKSKCQESTKNRQESPRTIQFNDGSDTPSAIHPTHLFPSHPA